MATALVVLAGAVFVGREAILERWYVYRLDSPDLEVRKQAIEKLGELGSESAAPRLIKIVQADDDPEIRSCAIRALEELGESGGELAQALTRVLNERGPVADHKGYSYTRRLAAERLIALGQLRVVLEPLRSVDRNVRLIALESLPGNASALPGVREALQALLVDERDGAVASEARRVLSGFEF